MKTQLLYILILCAIVGCSELSQEDATRDINLYQGHWTRHDTITSNEVVVEDLRIDNYALQYCQYNLNTGIIIDKQAGMILLGDNKKMEWNSVHETNNTHDRMFWTIKSIQDSSLWLFSSTLGNRIYRKESSEPASIDSSECMTKLISFSQLLPICYEEIKSEEYAIPTNDGIKILVNNPLCNHIIFKKSETGDSAYSYTFPTDCIETTLSSRISNMNFLHEYEGISDYSNAATLRESAYVISTNSQKQDATITLVDSYDYWYDATRYIGKSIEDVKQDFADVTYAYYPKGYNDSLPAYIFRNHGSKGFERLAIGTKGNLQVESATIEFTKTFIKEEDCLFVLDKKYKLKKMDNGVYTYKDYMHDNLSAYEIRYTPSKRTLQYLPVRQ